MARMAPAPTQTPSTAAMTGCGQPRIAFTSPPVMRVKRSSASASPRARAATSGPMISCTSPPEQKFPPAPVRTTARMSVAVRSAVNVAVSSA